MPKRGKQNQSNWHSKSVKSTHNTQHTTQHTTHNTQHTTHNTQHTTHSTQHTTHNTPHIHLIHTYTQIQTHHTHMHTYHAHAHRHARTAGLSLNGCLCRCSMTIIPKIDSITVRDDCAVPFLNSPILNFYSRPLTLSIYSYALFSLVTPLVERHSCSRVDMMSFLGLYRLFWDNIGETPIKDQLHSLPVIKLEKT